MEIPKVTLPYLPSPHSEFEFGIRPGRRAHPLRPDAAVIDHRRRILTLDRDECFAMPGKHARAFSDAATTVSRWIRSPATCEVGLDFEAVAASIAEDIVVLVPDDGHFIVAGGMVAMPSGWSIRQKLGLSIAQTHGTVPGFAKYLQGKTDRMLHSLKPGRFVERHNLIFNPSNDWTLLPDRWDELDQVRQSMSPADVATKIHLRTEYQSFARCDVGTTCLFCIRTYQSPIANLDAERRNELKAVLGSWSPEILNYKRITPMLESLIQYLG